MGKYDKLTGEVVDDILNIVKKVKNSKEQEEYLFYDKPLDFFLSVKIQMGEIKNSSFKYDAGQFYDEEADMSYIVVDLVIDSAKKFKFYNKLNAVLQDLVRHEIEHLTQYGVNQKLGKPLGNRKLRERYSKRGREEYKYYIMDDEIPAMVNGLYRKAKHLKVPLVDLFNDNLDELEKLRIIRKKINRNEILDKWIEYTKKYLPKAQL